VPGGGIEPPGFDSMPLGEVERTVWVAVLLDLAFSNLFLHWNELRVRLAGRETN
jgi:hypothetical protein